MALRSCGRKSRRAGKGALRRARRQNGGHASLDEILGLEGHAATDGADHRILIPHGLSQRRVVRDVTFDDAETLVLEANPRSIAREDRDGVPFLDGLGHEVPSGLAGRAEDEELHDGRILAPQAP